MFCKPLTEKLQEVFEQKSGQSLDDFFDFWFYGGYIPSVTAEIRYEEEESFLCVHTDIPFGVLDVPVRIHMPDRAIDAIISVKDGRGSAVLPNISEETEVVVDPLSLLLAFERKTKRVNGQTSCEE